MNGIILDLDKDLTNEQIDAVVKKLQAKKKVEVAPKAVLTKEEKRLLAKITKHVGLNNLVGYKDAYSVDHFDAEDYRKFVISHIELDMDDISSDMEGEIDCCEEEIENHIDQIYQAKLDMAEEKKNLEKYKKKLKQHKEMYKVIKQLEKEFAKFKK